MDDLKLLGLLQEYEARLQYLEEEIRKNNIRIGDLEGI